MQTERIKGRLERLENQIADLQEEASQERLWSDKRQRLDATIKRLEEETEMLKKMLNESPMG